MLTLVVSAQPWVSTQMFSLPWTVTNWFLRPPHLFGLGQSYVPDEHARRGRSLARSASSADEDANAPRRQLRRRTAGSATRKRVYAHLQSFVRTLKLRLDRLHR
jgi:hypothetical protein